jgi:hypothetical protein
MVRVEFSEEEVNYMIVVLNQFLKAQQDAITSAKDVLYMVDKFKNGEKVNEPVQPEKDYTPVEVSE